MPAALDLVGDFAAVRGDTFAQEMWFPDMSDVTFGDLRDRPTTASNDDLFFAFDAATLYRYTASGWDEVEDTLDAWQAILDGEDLSGSTFAGQIRRGPNAVDGFDLSIDDTDAATGMLVARATATATRQWPQGINVWEVQQVTGSTVATRLSGAFEVRPDTQR